jgi:hypothetical protein
LVHDRDWLTGFLPGVSVTIMAARLARCAGVTCGAGVAAVASPGSLAGHDRQFGNTPYSSSNPASTR